MDVHAKFNIQQAFVAKNDDIVKIWKMLEKEGMEVTATISCSDDFVRTFQNNESLIEYENSKRASITTLEIKARLADKPYSSSRAEITMKSDKFFSAAPISVSISGDENLVLPMRTKITDILHGMKPWYSWIATIELFYVGILIFMSLSLLLLFMSPPSNMPTPALPLDKALVRLVVDAAVIGGFCGFIWGIVWLRKYLFPVATFAIGQGLVRHEHKERIQWGVVISLLLGISASIIAAKMS